MCSKINKHFEYSVGLIQGHSDYLQLAETWPKFLRNQVSTVVYPEFSAIMGRAFFRQDAINQTSLGRKEFFVKNLPCKNPSAAVFRTVDLLLLLPCGARGPYLREANVENACPQVLILFAIFSSTSGRNRYSAARSSSRRVISPRRRILS